MDRLDSPAYFHLHKAQLMVREEADYIQFRFGGAWQTVEAIFCQTLHSTIAL
jgi:hypothetical protein